MAVVAGRSAGVTYEGARTAVSDRTRSNKNIEVKVVRYPSGNGLKLPSFRHSYAVEYEAGKTRTTMGVPIH